MLPVNSGGHTAYQTFVLENLRKYYPDPTAFAKSIWDIIERFWNLDLSYTDELLRCKYSVFVPRPRTPSCMQRSYLLSIDFKVHSLTDWAAQLKINPFDAILSGFPFGDTPGVGTFYDFLDRLWDSESDHLSPHIHPVRKNKVRKPKQKGEKAESIEKITVEQLFHSLKSSSFSIDEQLYASLFKIYNHEFLSVSIAGDGMPVVTSARERKHRICECSENGIQPFIDLNEKCGISMKYKDDFTIGKDGVPVCKAVGK